MMKINAFKLLAYGPFTDKVLDFSSKDFGLHVVYGLNEAGKSTALRALVGLFYGFGHIVEDDWLHDYNKLAVGASLNFLDGEVLNLSRYKRRKNDLINDDTGEPFEQGKLDLHLGKMGRENFEHAFGISHYSLRQGVESVLAAGGDLGHALFAATSGLNTLKQVMVKLESKHNLLFTPRKKTATINAGISQLNKLRKEQRDASASHRQWKLMKSRFDDLQRQEKEVIKRLSELTAEISLFARYRDALKYVTKLDKLQNDLKDIGPVPELPLNFRERRIEAQVEIQGAKQAELDLIRSIAEITKEIDELTFDDQLVGNASIIDDLAKDASLHAKGVTDSISLKAEIDLLRESAEKSLKGLRSDLTLEVSDNLRLSKPEKGKISRLGIKRAALKTEVAEAKNAFENSVKSLESAKSTLSSLGEPKDTNELEGCLERASEFGKLEHRISEARAEIAKLTDQADADIESIGLWVGNLDALEKMPIPSEETMRRFEVDLAELDQKLMETEKKTVNHEEQLEEKQKALENLTRVKELPGIDNLRDHRSLRDKGWRSVRGVWLNGEEPDPEFLAAFPGNIDLANAYEHSVAKADDTADILREDAEAVAKAYALRGEIDVLKEKLVKDKVGCQTIEENRRTLWDEWVKIWEPLGITALPPREMFSWAGRVVELRRRAADIRDRKVSMSLLKNDLDNLKKDMQSAMIRLGVSVPENISYASVLDVAKRIARDHEQLRNKRRELKNRIKEVEQDIDINKQRWNQAEQGFKAWTKDWAEAITPLDFGSDSRPEEIGEFILALDDVFADLDEAKSKKNRIENIRRDYQGYSNRVFDIVDHLAPDLKGRMPEETATELNARLATDKDRRKDRLRLDNEKKKKASELSKVKERLAAHQEALRLLCKEAKADDPEQLPEIEDRAKAKINVMKELNPVYERLTELASGKALETFVSEVKEQNPDELQAELERITAEKEELLKTERQLVKDIALANKDLDEIGGESKALEIAEEAEGLSGQIQSDVDQYVRLKLSHMVLAKAMERYRQSNQSPVLSIAGDYFKTMTQGSFAGLRADFDDKGDPVIKAKRPDGKMLALAEMSDGSRDQLFLALRLGGLARYVKANGPMPFIVDDVLVHFDDDRSAAALAALGELAKETQVVFFTHHKHLISLAESSVSDEILRVHTL
ncbi:MAG: AAA family ATPase [Deltaproteobacteria bacterium]|nr:AAA family ATPase [Deltaproteobacteria bacterium]